jgi:hypothetical protein
MGYGVWHMASGGELKFDGSSSLFFFDGMPSPSE